MPCILLVQMLKDSVKVLLFVHTKGGEELPVELKMSNGIRGDGVKMTPNSVIFVSYIKSEESNGL